MDAHFAVSFQIQNLRHPHPRKVPGSTQKWQEGIGVALTTGCTEPVTRARSVGNHQTAVLDCTTSTLLNFLLWQKWELRSGFSESQGKLANTSIFNINFIMRIYHVHGCALPPTATLVRKQKAQDRRLAVRWGAGERDGARPYSASSSAILLRSMHPAGRGAIECHAASIAASPPKSV